jgi:purine nucleosidase
MRFSRNEHPGPVECPRHVEQGAECERNNLGVENTLDKTVNRSRIRWPKFLMPKLTKFLATTLVWLPIVLAVPGSSQASPAIPEKIIIDTDIGDDVDDAFAVGLALSSPEVQILGITTGFGDTETRAKLVDRMLGEAGRTDIPVAAGTATQTKSNFTQRKYAEGGHFARASHPDATSFILEEIRRNPAQITLVAIGPLVNVGALIDKDAETFRKLKRVVMMGGSVERGYGDPCAASTAPQPEWNIVNDIGSAQKLFASRVPIYMMPLDSTQLKLDEVKRAFLFRQGTPVTDALTLLYHQWGQETPTLFDPMTIAFVVDERLCPVEAMRIRVDDKGMTVRQAGAPNAFVCLRSDPEMFFRFYLRRVGVR